MLSPPDSEKLWRVALISSQVFFLSRKLNFSAAALVWKIAGQESLMSDLQRKCAFESGLYTLLLRLCKWCSPRRRDDVHNVSTRA